MTRSSVPLLTMPSVGAIESGSIMSMQATSKIVCYNCDGQNFVRDCVASMCRRCLSCWPSVIALYVSYLWYVSCSCLSVESNKCPRHTYHPYGSRAGSGGRDTGIGNGGRASDRIFRGDPAGRGYVGGRGGYGRGNKARGPMIHALIKNQGWWLWRWYGSMGSTWLSRIYASYRYQDDNDYENYYDYPRSADGYIRMMRLSGTPDLMVLNRSEIWPWWYY